MTISADIDERRVPPGEREAASRTSSHSAREQAEGRRATYLLYIAAGIAPRLAMFVLLMVFTRLLPVEEFGLFALVVTMGEILDTTTSNWVRIYILRDGTGGSNRGAGHLGRALSLGMGALLLALLVAAVAGPLVSEARSGDLVLGTVVYIVAFSLARLTLTFAQLGQRHVSYAAIEWARAAGIGVAIAIVASLQIQSFLPASLILSSITGGIAAVSLLFTLYGFPAPRMDGTGYRAALEFGLPIMLATLLAYTLGWFDRIIINHFAGPASVAMYVAAFAIARQPVELLIGPLNSYIFPILTRTYNDGRARDVAFMQTEVLTSILAISAAAVAGLTLLAEPVATLFFPADYHASVVNLIPLVATGTLFLTAKNFVFDNSFHLTKQTWLLLATMVPAALISIMLGIFLIRLYGDLGAGIAYVASTLIALVISATVSLRVFSFEIPWRALARIATATAAASALTWVVVAMALRLGEAVQIVAGFVAFSLTYAVVLTALGISIRRLVELPWAAGR
jgi:O-antigen/teichoic acid export membrane protein